MAGCLTTLITLLVASVAVAAAWRIGGSWGWALGGAAVLVLLARLAALRPRRRCEELEAIDEMPGHDFELVVATLLESHGWRVELTPGSGDLGVDLVAEKRGERWAVQVKRQDAPVSRRAVSDAVAGRDHYHCTAAMVVTNNGFTRGAQELAASTECELVDRQELVEWITAARRRGWTLPPEWE